ncbi:hypothetical protein BLOT_004882 [Blomia tropicalis]|nr:hypothetical protein BLOT_004882 [Blomia tropicalis]
MQKDATCTRMKQTFEIGPVNEIDPSPRNGDFALNGAIDWLTPSASTNCSRNSTMVIIQTK